MNSRYQHRGLLVRCETQGWLDVFAEREIDYPKWFNILDEYLNESPGEPQYYHWMAMSFIRIYQLSRWLGDYVTAFLHIDRIKRGFSFDEILRSQESAIFQGTDIYAPSLKKTLGLGSHFVVRELARTGVLKSTLLDPHAFVAPKR